MVIPLNESIVLQISLDYKLYLFDMISQAQQHDKNGHNFHIKHVKDHFSSSDRKYPIYNIHISSNIGGHRLRKNNWVFFGSSDGDFGYYRETMVNGKLEERWEYFPGNSFRIADPNGLIRVKSYSMSLDHFGSDDERWIAPLKCLKFFDKVCEYESWADYDLQVDNSRL